MKKLARILGPAVILGLVVASRPGWVEHPAAAAGSCAGGRSVAVSDRRDLEAGAGIAAADGEAISVLGAGRSVRVAPPDRGVGVIRHVSVRAGVGTVYVRDRVGGDLVVAVTPTGVRRFAAQGEALHPSLSRRGDVVWAEGSGLRLVHAHTRAVRTVPGPVAGGLAFSPLFESAKTIVAAVSAPRRPAIPEDEYLSNLWRYDLHAGRWVQLTHLTGGADRWTVVRTPELAPDGSIQFVVVRGRASGEASPRYELWVLRGATASRLGSLPGERYLAGFDGSARLWNVRDGSTGAWRIQREGADGAYEDVGCGAVMVDPLDRADPDLRPGTRWARLSPTSDTGSSSSGAEELTATPATDAILIGDFASPGAAAAASARIGAALSAGTTIVDASEDPAIVQPGVWAVLVPLPSGSDLPSALARFREAVPEFAGWSWIVSV